MSSDSESDSAASPPPPSPPHSSRRAFAVPTKDSALDRLIQKQQSKRDREQAARAEANAQRTAAMDKTKAKKAKAKNGAPVVAQSGGALKSPGTLTWLVEGPAAFEDAPVPPRKHVASLKAEGFSKVGIKATDVKISREWTYQECLNFLETHLPIPYAATMDAIEAWKAAYPEASDEEVPPVFRVLSRDGKKLSVTRALRPTGLDMQDEISSASNWFERKLFITSGLDVSMYFADEVSVYRPCALMQLLEDDGPEHESEGESATANITGSDNANDDNAGDSGDNYEEPDTSGKRKRTKAGPATRSKRHQRSPSHISISDGEPSSSAQPVTRASVAKPLAASTLALTGFKSPPKRNRVRAV